jgi:Ca-activated chloride channel family protein
MTHGQRENRSLPHRFAVSPRSCARGPARVPQLAASLLVALPALLLGACAGSSSSAGNYGSGGYSGGNPPGARPPASGPGGSFSAGTGGSSSAPIAPPRPGASGAGGSIMGDQFVDVGTNPFVATSHDPFSTFAADVDTASYDIFRRDVNLGLLPQPASVRLEEYVNYFRYQYPAPTVEDAHPFRISLEAAGDVFDRRTALLRVGIQAVQPPPFQKRPANVVFLVDVSGSMADADKLPLVKRMLAGTLGILDAERDTVAVVTYSAQALVRLGPTPVSQAAAITRVIDGLVASGGTAGADALGLAYQEARRGYIEGGINHIVLCTDGDFNIGPSSTDELLKIVKRERASGVTMTGLGFGAGNLNDQMLEAISDAGNGMYAMISNAEQADRYVEERMLSTLVHVAKDMKIQVEFNPARVAAYRLLGYENRAIADNQFRNDTVDAGEVGAGHRVTALYELVLAGRSVPVVMGAPAVRAGDAATVLPEISADDLVLVKVRYKTPAADVEAPAAEVQTALPARDLRANLATCDPDLRFAAAVAALAEILKHSPYADRSFLPQIEAILNAEAAHDADRAELASLFGRIKPRL